MRLRLIGIAGPLLWGSVAVAMGLGGAALRLAARYDRAAIAAGELWRLLTGHLVHLGWGHVALNLGGLALLYVVLRPVLGLASWLGSGLAAVVAIDAGLFWLEPDLEWYVGLSGVLHGFWAAGAVEAWRRDRLAGAVLWVLLGGKLAWEQALGPLPTSASVGPVVVDAHLYGAFGGVLWCLAAGVAARWAGRSV